MALVLVIYGSTHLGDRSGWGWARLKHYAANQYTRPAPNRDSAGSAEYERYKAWCAERGLSNPAYIERFVRWRHDGVALEPSLAPYAVHSGIECAAQPGSVL